jgi:hypothetical protein
VGRLFIDVSIPTPKFSIFFKVKAALSDFVQRANEFKYFVFLLPAVLLRGVMVFSKNTCQKEKFNHQFTER